MRLYHWKHKCYVVAEGSFAGKYAKFAGQEGSQAQKSSSQWYPEDTSDDESIEELEMKEILHKDSAAEVEEEMEVLSDEKCTQEQLSSSHDVLHEQEIPREDPVAVVVVEDG